MKTINPATLTNNRRLDGSIPYYWIIKAWILNLIERMGP